MKREYVPSKGAPGTLTPFVWNPSLLLVTNLRYILILQSPGGACISLHNVSQRTRDSFQSPLVTNAVTQSVSTLEAYLQMSHTLTFVAECRNLCATQKGHKGEWHHYCVMLVGIADTPLVASYQLSQAKALLRATHLPYKMSAGHFFGCPFFIAPAIMNERICWCYSNTLFHSDEPAM